MDELLKQIEEDRKALSEIGEVVEDEEELEEAEETVEEPDDVEEPEEEVVEEVKEEPKEPEEKLDASGYARLRREKAMEKERADKLEARLAALEAKPKEVEEVESVEAPSLPPELVDVVENQRYNRAAQEFERMQNDFKEGIEDFDDVTGQYHAALVQSIAIQNPDMSPSEVQSEAVKTVLRKAGQYLNAGYNPVEKMYNDAKKLGFKKREVEAEVEVKKDPKPDMSKVAANRNRSAGTVAAPGGGGGIKMTREAVANLSPMEYMKLSREDREKALRG